MMYQYYISEIAGLRYESPTWRFTVAFMHSAYSYYLRYIPLNMHKILLLLVFFWLHSDLLGVHIHFIHILPGCFTGIREIYCTNISEVTLKPMIKKSQRGGPSVFSYCTIVKQRCLWPWWRHQMETFRVTGLLCGEFTGHRWVPLTKLVTRSCDISLICAWTNGWVNNRDVGDLRRHHYDVTVMHGIDSFHCLSLMHKTTNSG